MKSKQEKFSLTEWTEFGNLSTARSQARLAVETHDSGPSTTKTTATPPCIQPPSLDRARILFAGEVGTLRAAHLDELKSHTSSHTHHGSSIGTSQKELSEGHVVSKRFKLR